MSFRKYLILISIFLLAIAAFGQSGRVKTPDDSKPPTPPRTGNIYVLTQETPTPPVVQPTIAPEEETEEVENNSDVISFNSTLVPIPVSILDNRGNAVTSLTLENFQLMIDGKTAEISEISRSEKPLRLALLFDNSSSVSIAREFEKKAAIKFFKRIIEPKKDLAALYSVAGITQLEQPLTKNVSQLVRAIENFAEPQGATALLDGIVKAANYLQDQPGGRRVIVIVSDGEDTLSDLETTLEKVVRTVQAANCQIYIVKTTEFENYKRTGNRTGSANLRYLAAERRMQELAQQTGGSVYSPIDEKELDRAFAQISAELTQQYVLSYYPDDDSAKGGEFRNITLTVKDNPDLRIRTRKGYYVLKRN